MKNTDLKYLLNVINNNQMELDAFFKAQARTLGTILVEYVSGQSEGADITTFLNLFDEKVVNEEVFNNWISNQNRDFGPTQELHQFFKPLTGKTRNSIIGALNLMILPFRPENSKAK